MSRELEAQRREASEKLELERRVAQEARDRERGSGRLFPQCLPSLKTLDYAEPASRLVTSAGDYYDFLSLGNERLGFVNRRYRRQGHRSGASDANLQANLRSQFTLAREQPQLFLQSVNRLFYANSIESAYATVFFADYDDTAQRLRYANCGHLSAILLRYDGTVEWLHSTGTVLGLFEEWDRPSWSASSQPAICWRSIPMVSPNPSMNRERSSARQTAP